jgi:hypothetical protein
MLGPDAPRSCADVPQVIGGFAQDRGDMIAIAPSRDLGLQATRLVDNFADDHPRAAAINVLEGVT